MNAETIAQMLGGRKTGSGWSARCPAHQDLHPSLSLTNRGDKLLLFCHAGCSQDAVITALKHQGLWPKATPKIRFGGQFDPPQKGFPPPSDQPSRHVLAMKIWQESAPIVGTLAAVYLSSRGLLPPDSPSLRFHSNLKHRTGAFYPAMVGLVTCALDNKPMGIHRTFLATGGAAKAPVENPKLMLGQCRGGAVKFGKYNDQLVVAEGLETALSVYQSLQLPTWAALSTSGLIALNLPTEIRRVAIAADGDAAGEKAAQIAAKKWLLEGRTVRIARPPLHNDFNDLLIQAPQKDEA